MKESKVQEVLVSDYPSLEIMTTLTSTLVVALRLVAISVGILSHLPSHFVEEPN